MNFYTFENWDIDRVWLVGKTILRLYFISSFDQYSMVRTQKIDDCISYQFTG